MSWTKREVATDGVSLGDGEGQVKTIAGLLFKAVQNTRYPEKVDYQVVKKDGAVVTLFGSASLNNQIGPADVGKFFKARFLGWGNSANGRFKQIEVQVWEGEPTPEMKAWPRWAEAQAQAGVKSAAKPAESFDDFPPPPAAEDDDLPF